MLAGLATLFAGGVSWLAWFMLGPGGPVGLTAALQTGLYPFVVADLVKVCFAGAVLPSVWAILGRSKLID